MCVFMYVCRSSGGRKTKRMICASVARACLCFASGLGASCLSHYVSLYAYMYAFTNTYLHIYICTYVYICIYLYIYIYMCVCIYVCMSLERREEDKEDDLRQCRARLVGFRINLRV